jgi:hypothetical protein
LYRAAGVLARYIKETDEFTSETFAEYSKRQGLIGKLVLGYASNLFKGFGAAGLITKSDRYQTSKYGQALPVWKAIRK